MTDKQLPQRRKLPCAFRLSRYSRQQLLALAETTGKNYTEVVEMALDRLYQAVIHNQKGDKKS